MSAIKCIWLLLLAFGLVGIGGGAGFLCGLIAFVRRERWWGLYTAGLVLNGGAWFSLLPH
jgi:hypothetical protein